jgi:hypothetical protein
MYDRLRAEKDGVASTGNGRRQSYAHPPIPRMTNSYILNGPSKADDVLASTERGVYVTALGGGQTNPASGDFVFGVSGQFAFSQAVFAAVGAYTSAWATRIALFGVVPWLALSPHGVWESVHAQLGRGLHAESLGASVLLAGDRLGVYRAHVVKTTHAAVSRDLAGDLPDAFGYATSVLAAAAVVAVWLVFYRRRDRLEVAFAAAIAGVLAFAKVLSPQYLVWLIPFVPFVGLAAVALFVAALALAQSWYFHYHELWAVGSQAWTLLARNLVLVALYIVCLWKTSTPSRSKTSLQSGLRRSRTSAAAAGSGATRSA